VSHKQGDQRINEIGISTIKLTQFCLDCHGSAKHNPLNRNRPVQQWTNIDATGFEMENWTVNNFGGGVSVTIYEKQSQSD